MERWKLMPCVKSNEQREAVKGRTSPAAETGGGSGSVRTVGQRGQVGLQVVNDVRAQNNCLVLPWLRLRMQVMIYETLRGQRLRPTK